MVAGWSFRYYVGADGNSDVRAAYDAGTTKLQNKFRSRLSALMQLKDQEWREPLFKKLKGNAAGLGEIRFKADNVQQRPLGFQSGPNEFTILFWAIEKGSKFVPANACEIALRRLEEVKKNRTLTNEIWFTLE